MRRGIFIILIAIAGALIIWGFAKFQEGRMAEQIEAFAAIEDPAARIEAILAFVADHPNLEQAYVDQAAEGITESIGQLGESVDGATCIDKMLEGGVPDQLITPLLSEEHYMVLVNLYYAEVPGLAEKADALAREILERGDGTAQQLLGAAYIRSAIHPALTDRWPTPFPDTGLTLELADAGLGLEGDVPEWFTPVLISAYRPMLGEIILVRGPGTEVAFIDSLLAASPDGAHQYALHYHRFMRLREENGGAAMQSAHAMAQLMAEHGDQTSLNAVGYAIADSDLDPELGLSLCEQSLVFASSAEDSANVLDSIGWARYKLGDYDAAKSAILLAIDLTPGNPDLDDVMVTHLLDIYDASDDAEAAVELLAPIVARSPNPAENGGDALMLWLARAGDTASLSSVVTQYRYGGIQTAPDFTLTGVGGETVGLLDCEGSILVLNFWGAG